MLSTTAMNSMVDFQDASSPLEDSNSHTPPLKTRGRVKVKDGDQTRQQEKKKPESHSCRWITSSLLGKVEIILCLTGYAFSFLHGITDSGVCSFRYGLALLLHVCNSIIMSQRTCLSLTMVVMVNSSGPHGVPNTSTEESLDVTKNPVYNWSPKTQGIIFSSISYGTLIIQIPVGYLSEKYSIKKMIGSALLLSSLFSLILPMAAEGGEACIIACRAAQGVSQGSALIAQHAIWVKWAPPLERGRLTSLSLSGVLLGPFIVLLVTGFICQSLGWPMVFYIFGACGCGVSLLWFLLFYDDPKTHPCISVSEKNYILSSLNQQQSSSRTQSLPIKAMIKSLPLWAIVFGSFAFHWTNIMLLYTPTFVDSNLHVNVKENGLLSALPYLFAWSFGILAGHAADFLLSRNILRLNTIRKLFSTLGLFLPPFFGLCLVHLSFSFYSTIVFLILTCSTGSFCMTGVLINALDIAPSYYGFLKGVTNVIGMIGGLISSILCGMMLNENPESGWFKIFFLMAGVNVTSLLFCLIFGKAEIQNWDKDRPEQTRL